MVESVVLTVMGMKCGGCESNVETRLKNLPGVISVAVSCKDSEVQVEFDNDKTSVDVISQTITDAGFGVE